MAKSVKTNYLLTLANAVTGILFPMISFPYASRILMADGIGQVNFFQSIISYFTLIACLGIPTYAIRKVARLKDDPAQLSHTVTEILIFNSILTFVVYLVALTVGAFVAKISVDYPLFILMSLSIGLTSMGCEWFYQGREDFKYITVRGIIVKTIATILMFVLVRDKQDVLWYGLYTVVGSVGGNVFNMVRLRKFVKRKHIRRSQLRPMRHMRPALKVFMIYAMTTIYLQFNTIMLGFIDDSASVGYYAGATRIMRIAIEIVAALGVAMLPRMSQYIKAGDQIKFAEMAQKAYGFVIALTLPMALGMAIVSPILIPIFCGDSYEPAILTLSIVAPAIIAIGIANVLSVQILYPQEKENLILRASFVGLIVSIVSNLILIPVLSQNGAAISLVLTEISVTLTMGIVGRNYIPVKYLGRRFVMRLVSAMIMGVTSWIVMQIEMPQGVSLIISIITGVTVYASALIITRDPVAFEIIKFIHLDRLLRLKH